MFVKQIDVQEALRLAGKGKEILVLAPTTPEPKKWTDYEPNALQNLLAGCLFFRPEPAMEVSEMETELQALGEKKASGDEGTGAGAAGGVGKPSGRRVGAGAKRKPVDIGKLMALHNAGWSNVKIADELRVSDATVGRYLKQMEGQDGNEGKHQNDTGVGE